MNEIQPRPIPRFPAKIKIKKLPPWHGNEIELKIYVSPLDKAVHGFREFVKGITVSSKLGWYLIKLALLIDSHFSNSKGKPMIDTILNWLKQRRVWVSIFSVLSIVLKLFGVEIDPETETAIIDQGMILVSLIPDAINAILALWSYIKPKPTT